MNSCFLRSALLAASLILPAPVAMSGYFNCAVIYDEFESLMNNQFLVEPDRFAATQRQSLSRPQFERLQKGRFHLYPERADLGIAIFRTNQNLHGKMLFHWEEVAGNETHLVIDEAVIFGRVADGYASTRHGPLRIKPGVNVDLDTFDYVIRERGSATKSSAQLHDPLEDADLVYGLDPQTGEPTLAAVNQATLQFPTETLCHDPRRR